MAIPNFKAATTLGAFGTSEYSLLVPYSRK